jgi:hypothetical protein
LTLIVTTVILSIDPNIKQDPSQQEYRTTRSDEQALPKMTLTSLTRVLLAWMAISSAGLALATVPDAQSAASLRAKYLSLGEQLRNNPFQRALTLDSSESSSDLKGDIYALVDYPFATVSAALNGAEEWCDVLILHINTKYCHATTDEIGTILRLGVGKKTAQPLDDAYPLAFSYRVAEAKATFLEIRLDAEEGPLSTRNYHIQLQAVPVGNGRTFMHFTYSYEYGLAGRLAMKAYLATIGSDKVGFTIIGKLPDGQPEYIGGMRGVAERNTMRYYLAIDAFLGALNTQPPLQLRKRLQSWFTATEQYPRQLHEVGRTAYFEMKQSEYLRQQTVQ